MSRGAPRDTGDLIGDHGGWEHPRVGTWGRLVAWQSGQSRGSVGTARSARGARGIHSHLAWAGGAGAASLGRCKWIQRGSGARCKPPFARLNCRQLKVARGLILLSGALHAAVPVDAEPAVRGDQPSPRDTGV